MDNKDCTSIKSKKNLLIKIMCYTICALLLVFYFVILLLNTDVCAEYRLYYIDDVLVDWCGYNGLTYESGTVIDFGEGKKDKIALRKGRGWDTAESECIKAVSNGAPLFFKLKDDALMTCTIDIGTSNVKSYIIKAGNTTVYTNTGGDGTQAIFDIDPSFFDDNGVLRLSFEFDASGLTEPPYIKVFSVVLNTKEA